ncbi:uncharacterized protein B0H18DRAFT_985213 [Fomitopsis serialis]|uniref:uncharacterized protein n=1 Tax=Fomitopsis serialis TaxID=139415 RepID=UPI0020088E04|nr:uncharacterized protein B0H18DRAFT_985213 [Neoantrodia serialis]KAH9933031.1 hypothetical protein B0H18DRAFT_985213 [Neoantrodia serialis]
MSPVAPLVRQILPRKGGGGGHGGGDGGGGDGGHGGDAGDSGSEGESSAEDVPVSGATDGESDAEAYGSGGGSSSVIPSGQPFAGRASGGGTRGEVYGTYEYGSGYPGLPAGTVSGRGFPFVYWPVIWHSPGYGAPYLYDPEYGTPWNTSRPGGPLAEATFASKSANSTFYVISDKSTVASLITSVSKNCTLGGGSSAAPSAFNATASEPQPEQAVQYYRASSVVLLLDGYNNTNALAEGGGDASATAVALPDWVDHSLLACLHDTIGGAVPLFSGGAPARAHAPNFAVLIVMWWFLWRLCDEA